jgi:hypothetical protein
MEYIQLHQNVPNENHYQTTSIDLIITFIYLSQVITHFGLKTKVSHDNHEHVLDSYS